MEQREEWKERLMAFLQTKEYKPLRFKELCFLMDIRGEDRDEFLDLLLIAVFDRMRNAVQRVLLDDLLAEASDRGTDRLQLDQNVRAVLIRFDHLLHMLQMSDDPRNAVQLFLLLFGVVHVGVRMFSVNLM